jgi:predicted nucleic acid-binding protein
MCLIDTTSLTDALRGDSSLLMMTEEAIRVWVSFVSVAEIQAGLFGSTRTAQQ